MGNIIELLKIGDQKALGSIYKDYRSSFLLFAKKYDLAEDEVLDIYQDAIIAFSENAKRGLLDDLKSNISTYLFGIGKYMIYNKFKSKKDFIRFDEKPPETIIWDFYEDEQENEETYKLQTSFKKLGEQCQKVLQLFYYEEKKLDDILKELNYSSKDVLKSQKSRCLKQLKEIMNHDK